MGDPQDICGLTQNTFVNICTLYTIDDSTNVRKSKQLSSILSLFLLKVEEENNNKIKIQHK